MKHTIIDSRRKVVSAVICAYPGGRECAAALLGLELKKFDNHAYESAGHRPLADEQIHALEQVAGTTFVPEYLCSLYGGVFVPMPQQASLDNVELYRMALDADVKEGRVDQVIAKALASGDIDEQELAEIVAAHRIHVAARHAEVGAVITLHRGQRVSSYYRLKCPKCHGPMKVRASTEQHVFLRVMYLQRQYAPCSWAVRAEFQMTHELAPSGEPNPAVSLPLVPSALLSKARLDNRLTAQSNQLDLLEAPEAHA